jgi:uncharacterized protein (TIGR03435 family)
MRAFALILSALVDKTVTDETGLKGSYDFKLEWLQEGPLIVSPSDSATPAPLLDRETIFANRANPIGGALEEQLGLELQSAKGPVETFVIDHVERPSEN